MACGVSFYYYFGQGGLNCLQRHLMGPSWPARTLLWGPWTHCMLFLNLTSDHEFCLLIFFLKLYFLNLTIWNSSICALISIDRTSDKILAILKKVTRWRYRSEFLKSKTKTNISPLRMRSQGCPGCQNFWNFVLKMNLLVCSAKIQLKLSKLPKYGQKQRFFRSFFAFFAFFQFWLNISALNL